MARKADIEAALTAAKLPAEMTARLKGDTREELEAVAKAQAEVLGFNALAQGKTLHPKTRALADALRALPDR